MFVGEDDLMEHGAVHVLFNHVNISPIKNMYVWVMLWWLFSDLWVFPPLCLGVAVSWCELLGGTVEPGIHKPSEDDMFRRRQISSGIVTGCELEHDHVVRGFTHWKWWFSIGLEQKFYEFRFSGECHHPNWWTPSFFGGVGIPPTGNV